MEQPTQVVEPKEATPGPMPQSGTPWVRYGAIGCAVILGLCVVIFLLVMLFGDEDPDAANVHQPAVIAEPRTGPLYGVVTIAGTPAGDPRITSRAHLQP